MGQGAVACSMQVAASRAYPQSDWARKMQNIESVEPFQPKESKQIMLSVFAKAQQQAPNTSPQLQLMDRWQAPTQPQQASGESGAQPCQQMQPRQQGLPAMQQQQGSFGSLATTTATSAGTTAISPRCATRHPITPSRGAKPTRCKPTSKPATTTANRGAAPSSNGNTMADQTKPAAATVAFIASSAATAASCAGSTGTRSHCVGKGPSSLWRV